MIKIFPFYKGKNIANNEFGYTTVANARKRMDRYDVRKDFNATLPIDYWIDHSYVMRLENPWKDDYGRRWGLNVAHGYYGVEYTTEGYTKDGSQTYLKDLPSDIFDLIRNMEDNKVNPILSKKLETVCFDELIERLGSAYKMDYSKMESYINLDELINDLEIK